MPTSTSLTLAECVPIFKGPLKIDVWNIHTFPMEYVPARLRTLSLKVGRRFHSRPPAAPSPAGNVPL